MATATTMAAVTTPTNSNALFMKMKFIYSFIIMIVTVFLVGLLYRMQFLLFIYGHSLDKYQINICVCRMVRRTELDLIGLFL